MSVEFLAFDPDGDLLLRLPCPEEEVKEVKLKEGNSEMEPLVNNISRDHTDGALTPEEEADELMEESGPPREIHMLVSAKHLTLASPVFRAMLQHSNFKEGDELRRSGRVEVLLPDDDHVAFGIMMYIIHGRVRKIPRKVSLEVMTNLSILVDKYQTLEVFELILDVWMPELENNFPTTLNKDVLPWLSIAWVFQLPDPFKKLTKILASMGNGIVDEERQNSLPIPSRIFERIEARRLEAIQAALNLLEIFFKRYQGPGVVCTASKDPYHGPHNIACDGTMIGTYLRSASSHNLWPAPLAPFKGWSVTLMTMTIRKLDIKSMCDVNIPRHKSGYEPTRSHGVRERMNVQTCEIEYGILGLDISMFPAKS
ncbi:hypothetical protein BKA65DRAFT_244389 [Rhexocercosporidium sp. MPI-PUGE-AT-0058]|nr:hypothetical protein BKA65DRAFT_244389 [Rhexocercosporidium sp. MPI-PUGE-AT-0058]